jgi:hypothetical protein
MQQPDTTQSGDFQKGVRDLNEKLAAISTPELLEKCGQIISDLCRSGAKSWALRVPPSINCPDMLLTEALRRLKDGADIVEFFNNIKPEKHTDLEPFNE